MNLNTRLFRFRNDSEEVVPARGIVRLDGYVQIKDNTVYYTAVQPDSFGAQYLQYVNSTQVPVGGYGACYAVDHVWAAYDAGEDPDNPLEPQIGESWGPVNGSWKLHRHVGGFRVMAVDLDKQRVLVMRQPLLQMEASLDEPLTHGGQAQATPLFYNGSIWDRLEDETIVVYDARGIGGIANAGAIINVYWEQTLGGWVGVSRGCTFAASS